MEQESPGLDRREFELIYEEYQLPLLAYCARRVGMTDASDACSETFLVAWRRHSELPKPPKTLPYLYGVAAKVISNQRRGLVRRSRLAARLKSIGLEPADDPYTVTAHNEQDLEVAAAIQNLPSKDREIVMLYAWEELPREVIAEAMGMSKAAVDQRIHRAYRRIAQSLAPRLNPNSSPLIAEEGAT